MLTPSTDCTDIHELKDGIRKYDVLSDIDVVQNLNTRDQWKRSTAINTTQRNVQ